ncbi:MAG: polysaccharide deacetylase family protein [Chloroflexi bacterium]|nr:polysaccharide deacetylase family protein [Chloroflexota bacterium]
MPEGAAGTPPAACRPAETAGESLLRSLECVVSAPRRDWLDLVDPAALEQAARALAVPYPPATSRLARRLLGPVLLRLPARARLVATGLLKRLRSPSRRLAYVAPADFAGDRLVAALAGRYPLRLWGLGRRFCLALTHDVDTRIGYDFVPTLVDELRARGLRSSFYLLTHGDYRVEPALVRALVGDGFEVALHGATHDVGIGYRPRAAIRDWLARAGAALGGVPAGFRAPGLGVSSVLLEEVARAGFAYDSSYQTGSRLYPGVGYSFPYRLPGLPLVEVPVWFQDAFLFRDAGLDLDDALSWCQATIGQLRERSAAVVFVMHPDNVVGRRDFMRRFLDLVAAWRDDDALVCPLVEVVRRFEAADDAIERAP